MTNAMEIFLVGGMVRDEIMGVASKDADFSVVLNDADMAGSDDPFDVIRQELIRRGFKIFVETPEHFTIRAQFPKGENEFGVRDADFVLAREEGPYSDGRRPDWVKPGTLFMDQQRRDFTMNAIAKDADGSLIDPFNGVQDIEDRIIRAVGDPVERLTEDALRAVRALRFSVTKGFQIDPALDDAMREGTIKALVRDKISDERIQVELSKMFRFDTVASLKALSLYSGLTEAMFAGSVSLDATMKQKGRGK